MNAQDTQNICRALSGDVVTNLGAALQHLAQATEMKDLNHHIAVEGELEDAHKCMETAAEIITAMQEEIDKCLDGMKETP